MSGLRALLARLRSLLGTDSAKRLDQEMESHAEMLSDDYIARGMTPEQAWKAARREIGNKTLLRQQYREQSGLPLLENSWMDLKYSMRILRRNPTFAIACIATLTVGLGAMITVLCVVSTVLRTPLPYPDAARLIVVHETDPRGGLWPFSEPTLLDLEARATSLSAVAGYRTAKLTLTGAGEPEVVAVAAVTPSFFRIFGVAPGAANGVMISRSLWERKWQMDQGVMGRPVVLDGGHYTISGVSDPPRDLLPGVEVLLPFVPKINESRSAHDIQVVGKLRAGVGQRQAQAELSAVAEGIARENAPTNKGWGLRTAALDGYLLGPDVSRMIWMVFGAVALLWLLACANVARIQMARSVMRRHEMGTRISLGASRGRLIGQALMESLVLACFGGIFGLAAAQLALEALHQFGEGMIPRLASVEMNAKTAMIATGCMLFSTVLSGLLSGGAPAYRGDRGISARAYGRDALIVVQVALASVLMLGASLLFESFMRLEAVDPGFNTSGILTVGVNKKSPSHLQQELEALIRLPEVAAVGATNVLPFGGSGTANRFRVEEDVSTSEFRSASWRAVTPGFFKTVGIPLKQGRFFTDADGDGSLEVVILSERMAQQFWPKQNPIGKRLLWGRSGSPKTIVGIVGDLRDLTVDAPPEPTMFRPQAQLSDAPMTLVIRTRREPVAAIADIRNCLRALDKNAAFEFRPLDETMAESIRRPRANLMAVGAFAGMALITAGLGLYGLISYRVNQRRQEIGIRLALGAKPSSIRWNVLRRCLLLVGMGAGVGMPLAFILSKLITSLLYQTKPTQLSAYLIVLIAFAGVALAASMGPARKAANMNPVAAIRHE